MAAIAARDPRADGAFVYAVRTTGIYCRPSCPSRRALSANIELLATPAAAERAGYRACRRCRPNLPTLPDPIVDAVAVACRRLAATDPAPPLAELAASAGYSPAHFHRAFRRLTGLTPKAYARAAHAGTAAPARAAEVLHYTLATTPLGMLLVAAGERGVRSIALGDDETTLLAGFARAFPTTQRIRDDAALGDAVARIVAFIATPGAGLVLPLDVRGSAFQHRVWDALRHIPVGSTVTYGALAAQLGMPAAPRAVARACATNGLALAIPCHRVIAANASLSGYRWGLERKRSLLVAEGAQVPPVSAKRRGR